MSTAAPTTDATRMPSQAVIQDVLASTVLDKQGKDIVFKDLMQSERTITVFIRHFDCGNCMEYVRALSKYFASEKLTQLRTRIIVVGCGAYTRIDQYVRTTNCPFDVYADPTRATYNKLGFVVSLSGGTGRPQYIQRSFLQGLVESMSSTVKGGLQGGGKINQNGGEMIWVGSELNFIHRMQNTTGHMEVDQLEVALNNAVAKVTAQEVSS